MLQSIDITPYFHFKQQQLCCNKGQLYSVDDPGEPEGSRFVTPKGFFHRHHAVSHPLNHQMSSLVILKMTTEIFHFSNEDMALW